MNGIGRDNVCMLRRETDNYRRKTPFSLCSTLLLFPFSGDVFFLSLFHAPSRALKMMNFNLIVGSHFPLFMGTFPA